MKFFGLIFTLLAAFALAQDQPNYINVPQGGFNIRAGQPFTVTWSNPSAGDVTIRLTQGNLVDNSDGITLGTFPASAETATFTVPTNVNNGQYNFAIQSTSDTSIINFSSAFQIGGATGIVDTSSVANTATSVSSASMSGASMSSGSTSTETSSGSSTSSGASSTGSASSTSSGSTRSSSSTASQTSASATAATSVAANSATFAKAGGMLAMMAGALAVF